jgi:hypothetical protein
MPGMARVPGIVRKREKRVACPTQQEISSDYAASLIPAWELHSQHTKGIDLSTPPTILGAGSRRAISDG